MFTGLITDLGRVRSAEGEGDKRLVVETAYDLAGIDHGASVACAGVCLTVIGKEDGCLTFDVSAETIARSSLGDLEAGDHLNLERPLRVGDELGGHIVSGHVDGTASLTGISDAERSKKFTFELPQELMRFAPVKGSITLDGVSLTINEVSGHSISVNLVPHTLAATSFQHAKPGDRINVEVDLLARYLERLAAGKAAG
ncbi:MAG: riboflavin synthase [Sphingomonadales bacterium]